MYHYCAASPIYNVIRVFICAYVWMTVSTPHARLFARILDSLLAF